MDEAASALGALLVGPARRGDAQRTITIGALVLELAAATAALWPDEEASGRVDLLRMLESRLAGQEEAALCGDPGYRPLPQRVQCLAESVSQRIQGPLARDPCRTAQPVQRSLVEMASLAVRASVNLQRFGDASGPTASPPCGWYAHLVNLAWELRDTLSGSHGRGRVGSAWLGAVTYRAPIAAIREIADARTDRSLRADGLLTCRNAWLRRGSSQLSVWSLLAPVEPFTASVAHRVAANTSGLLRASDLARRPGAFRHLAAWEGDQHRLLDALRCHLDSPETGWDKPALASRRLLLMNVSRAMLAVALIDAELGDRPALLTDGRGR